MCILDCCGLTIEWYKKDQQNLATHSSSHKKILGSLNQLIQKYYYNYPIQSYTTDSKMSTSTHLLLSLCALIEVAYTACTDTTSNSYCWTPWMDRDNPSGTGDWEVLRDIPLAQVCPRPVGIECQTTSGQPYQSTGTNTALV